MDVARAEKQSCGRKRGASRALALVLSLGLAVPLLGRPLMTGAATDAATGAAEPGFLFRTDEFQVSERYFTRIDAVLRVTYPDPGARRERMEGRVAEMRRALVLATAARREGLEANPAVAAALEKYRWDHLADLYLEQEVIAPAREYARREAAGPSGEREKLLYGRERGRLMDQLRAASAELVETVVFKEAIAAALAGREENPVVARIGDREVRFEALRSGLTNISHPTEKSGTDQALAEAVLETYLGRRRIQLAAERKGYAERPAYLADLEDKTIEVLAAAYAREKVFAPLALAEKDFRAYYDRHREQFRRGEEKEVYEILVAGEQAADRIRRLLRGGASFDDLVKDSVSVTREKGGFLGYIQAGDLLPPLDAAVSQFRKKGEVSRVVRTSYGFHVLVCGDVQEGRIPPFGEIGKRGVLLAEKGLKEEALARKVKELEATVSVEVNEVRLRELREK